MHLTWSWVLAAVLVAGACGGSGSDADDHTTETRRAPSTTTTTTTVPSTTGVVACAGLDPPLNDFYERCEMREGMLVAGSAAVADEAITEALRVVEAMTASRPDVRSRLLADTIFTAVIAANEPTTVLPELEYLRDDPDVDWDARARGFGSIGAGYPTSAGEENLLCQADDRYAGESILVHEFAHTLFDQGIVPGPEGAQFQERLAETYADAMRAGLWTDSYAATNESEYWAVGVQSYFDAGQAEAVPGIANGVGTRAELVEYDPQLAALIGELLRDDWSYACP